jgi:hypothetical protein
LRRAPRRHRAGAEAGPRPSRKRSRRRERSTSWPRCARR